RHNIVAKKCGRFSRRFWKPALSGILGGPIGMSGYLLSIHYLTIYYAAPLSSLFPVFAALMSYWILKEKISKTAQFGFGLAVIASALLAIEVGQKANFNTSGLIFLAICILGWSSEIVISSHTMRSLSGLQVYFLRLCGSTLGYLLILLVLFLQDFPVDLFDFSYPQISTGTSTLDQVEVGFTPTRSYIVQWAKSVTWATPELEQGKLLGLALDTAKIMVLNQNAQQTLQKVAFLGHAKDTRLTGLLNNPSVEVYNIKGTSANTKVQAMDFDKSVAFFKEMFLAGMEKTKRIEAPNTFAIDLLDLAHLALTQRNNTDTTALEFLTKSLSAAAGRDVA
ncbi:lic-1 protein B, partial [Haemophilus influenzae HK1212]